MHDNEWKFLQVTRRKNIFGLPACSTKRMNDALAQNCFDHFKKTAVELSYHFSHLLIYCFF
jgi:hypothetical protein